MMMMIMMTIGNNLWQLFDILCCYGKDQVMVGVVSIGNPNLPEQSAKSVYPLAIANCKEDGY